MSSPSTLISFKFLRDALAARWRLVALVTALGLLFGILFAILSGGKYLISMTVIPAETDTERTGLTAQLPTFLSPGSDAPVSKFKQFQSEIFSYQTAALLDRRYGMLCEINPNRCDMATRRWEPRPEWRRMASSFLSAILGKPVTPDTPQIGSLVDYIYANVNVTKAQGSSLTTITTTSRDPSEGMRFLSRLVDAANQAIRERDRTDLRQYVAYLSKRLENLHAVDQRIALDNLLLTEERRLMLTEVEVAYAATPIDGPNAVPTSSGSRIVVGTAMGFALGCIAALLLQLIGGRRPSTDFAGLAGVRRSTQNG